MELKELWLQFEERFGGSFLLRAGSGGYSYTKGHKTLLIPHEEGEVAVELMGKSLQTGKDLLEERYKNNVFKPKKGVLY